MSMSELSEPDAWERAVAGAELGALAEFESWLYAAPEGTLPYGAAYLALISIDFRRNDAAHEIQRIVREAIGADAYDRAVARAVARRFLAGTLTMQRTASMLSALRLKGAEWVPSEFAYVDSELDSVPAESTHGFWDPTALEHIMSEASPRLKEFERGMRAASVSLLRAARSGPPEA